MRCLIVASADCVWDDAERATQLTEFDGVIAVKRMVEVWKGPLVAFASLHADTIASSLKIRRSNGLPPVPRVFCIRQSVASKGLVTDVLSDWGGSSGLFAVKVALHLGYTRIVVAGMPLDRRPYFNNERVWQFAPGYVKGWHLHSAEFAPYVRSMSGWTRKFLGEPTVEWLNESIARGRVAT